MTTHDERATVAPTQTAEPEFSNTGTEAPRESDERLAEPDQDQIADDATSPAHAEQPRAAHAAEQPRAGEVPPPIADDASSPARDQSQAGEVPPSADVPASAEPNVRGTNCSSPPTLPACARGGTTSRQRLSTTCRLRSEGRHARRRGRPTAHGRFLRGALAPRGAVGAGRARLHRGSSIGPAALSRVLPATARGLRIVTPTKASDSNRPATHSGWRADSMRR